MHNQYHIIVNQSRSHHHRSILYTSLIDSHLSHIPIIRLIPFPYMSSTSFLLLSFLSYLGSTPIPGSALLVVVLHCQLDFCMECGWHSADILSPSIYAVTLHHTQGFFFFLKGIIFMVSPPKVISLKKKMILSNMKIE